MKWLQLTLELVIGLILLFAVVKIAGKKLISQMSPFTFIAAIVLGELLGNALYDDHIHLWYIIYSITLWGAMLLLVEYASQKWLSFRLWSEGKPTLLIRNGVIDYEALKKAASPSTSCKACSANMRRFQSVKWRFAFWKRTEKLAC